MRKLIPCFFILILIICFNQEKAIAQNQPKTKTSVWKGFERVEFPFEGMTAYLVRPAKPLAGNPWLWKAMFFDWHADMDSILLSEGFHVAYVDAVDMFGSPRAVGIWDRFYDYLRANYQLNEKVSLEGVSRGGLYAYSWAKKHPERINAIYGEAPVCDFKSWPGGFGRGVGSKGDWDLLKKEFGFKSDEEAKVYANVAYDNLDKLAAAKVPLIHMIGLDDKVVPPEENTFILFERYKKLGGPAMLVPCTLGKQDLMGHHFPIETPRMAANFIICSTVLPKPILDPSDFHELRGGLRNSFIRFERDKKGRVAFLGGSITWGGGWRDSICNYLKQRFPSTEFEFINAGVPSMGSTPAAFRMEQDILSHGPVDLLFEEAAVNDDTNEFPNVEQIRAMEGIVRHTLAINAKADIVFMHFVDPGKIEMYRKGQVPQVIQNHERVAIHYQVPSINLAKEVTARIDAGEFTWEKDFKDLHPSPFGQHIYFRSMKSFLDRAWSGSSAGETAADHFVPAPLDNSNYGTGALIDIHQIKAAKGWTIDESWQPKDGKGTRENYTDVPMLVNEGDSGTLKYRFIGNAVGIAVAAGPDAGIIEYSIDGGPLQQRDLFTDWSAGLHLPWFYTLGTGLAVGGKSGASHEIQIRMAADKNSKSNGRACRIRYLYVNR
jgi:sialidase-1